MKTLQTKKINLFLVWANLKNMPPRAFNTIDSMERALSIMETIEGAIPDFVKISKEGEEIHADPEAKDYVAKVKEYQKRSLEVETASKDEVISIDFEDAVFNEFFQQEETNGKLWFKTIQDYLAFRKDMIATNGQPKEKKSNIALA